MHEPATISSKMRKASETIFLRQQEHQKEVARTSARQRKDKLRQLHATVLRHRDTIKAALYADFKKPPQEVDITEVGAVNTEIRYMLRHLDDWMSPQRVGTGLPLIGSSARIRYEPKGVCLLLGPWNFPINLNLIPLVGAVAAGNCAIIKPSEHAPHSAQVLKTIVAECFPEEEVAVVEGDAEVARNLLDLPFNHVFFTGSTAVGKLVMAAAAKHLASVTLELGGKSPVLVDETADLDRVASRVVWLKCLNAGQICIAPDYVLVHESVHDALVQKLSFWIKQFYGATPAARQQSPDLGRVIHDRQFAFLQGLLDDAVQQGGQVAFGGSSDAESRYWEPTILTNVPDGAAIWQHEIFGSLLPLRRYGNLDEAIGYINKQPKPLALYVFSRREKNIQHIVRETRSGGACINECGLQYFNPELPFGGQNASGIGKYHGKFSFLEFSHARGIARQHSPYPTSNLFLPPYGSKLMNKTLDWLTRWL